jgi:hypothetical protein
VDPNAKPATICKNGHKRIWHSANACPLCGAIAWGKKQQEIAGRWQAQVEVLAKLVERAKREALGD